MTTPQNRMNRRDWLRNATGLLAALTVAPRSFGVPDTRPQGDSSQGGPRQQFWFLHSYEATGRYWRGLEKAGMIRPNTGVRLVNPPWGDDDRRFNSVARPGGALHAILAQRKCPFVIDRVAGGAPYHVYDFDPQIVAAYARMLGDRFLGGQVHETVCNTHNDWNRFPKANAKFDSAPIDPAELRSFFTWSSADKWLEYGTLDDYAGQSRPKTEPEWWAAIERNARRQGMRFGGHWVYAEGSGHGMLSWPAMYKFGASAGMAEVGVWASNQSPFTIASLRGAARAARKPWGVFFAVWGPGGCTSFIPEKDWSWQCQRASLDDSGWPIGPNLGASSALQRRIFFHAFMSGAHYLYEEWGAEGNLLNWEDGKLSSYGRVTRDLLDFTNAHPDVGEPYTPIALIVDAAIPPGKPELWNTICKGLYQYDAQMAELAKRPGSGEAEVACYGPCVVPELFDIVPADAPIDVLDRYPELINVSSSTSLPARAKSWPAEQLLNNIVASVNKLSPFARKRNLPMQINRRRADGAWIVACYNPWGATRGDVENTGSVLDDGCTISDTLVPALAVKSARILHAWPASCALEVRPDGLHITVGAGGTLVMEILPAS
jgi:hypothetical protein